MPANDLPPIVGQLIGLITKESLNNGAEPFTLHWTGSKIPRGYKVNGVEIGWTQHGLVTGVNGEDLGTYDRTIEWGGPNHDEHEMVITPKKGPWCKWLDDKLND